MTSLTFDSLLTSYKISVLWLSCHYLPEGEDKLCLSYSRWSNLEPMRWLQPEKGTCKEIKTERTSFHGAADRNRIDEIFCSHWPRTAATLHYLYVMRDGAAHLTNSIDIWPRRQRSGAWRSDAHVFSGYWWKLRGCSCREKLRVWP